MTDLIRSLERLEQRFESLQDALPDFGRQLTLRSELQRVYKGQWRLALQFGAVVLEAECPDDGIYVPLLEAVGQIYDTVDNYATIAQGFQRFATQTGKRVEFKLEQATPDGNSSPQARWVATFDGLISDRPIGKAGEAFTRLGLLGYMHSLLPEDVQRQMY